MVGQILPMLAVLKPYPAAIAGSLATDDLSTKRSAVWCQAPAQWSQQAVSGTHGRARRKLTGGRSSSEYYGALNIAIDSRSRRRKWNRVVTDVCKVVLLMMSDQVLRMSDDSILSCPRELLTLGLSSLLQKLMWSWDVGGSIRSRADTRGTAAPSARLTGTA